MTGVRLSRVGEVNEWAGKLTIVVFYLPLVQRILGDVLATGRITGLLLLATTSLSVAFTLVRRSAGDVDRSWEARAVTLAAVGGPLLFRPLGVGIAPDQYTGLLSLVGIFVTLAGLFALRRSFGLVPANRGIVRSGCYRVIRHPIYAGYLLSHAAFVLAYFAPWNVAVWVFSDVALLVRLGFEERLLIRDPAYAQYTERVRWRVVPGVF